MGELPDFRVHVFIHVAFFIVGDKYWLIMFKLESYIAPILLSYVDKYIKNFRLEDSQASKVM